MPSVAQATSPSCGRSQPPLTRPVSFRFATEERASTAVKMLPTDELRMMQAKEEVREMRSSKSTPDSTPTRRSPSVKSGGSTPLTETKPFRFKSEERHRKALENMQNKNNSAGRLKVPESEEEVKELAKLKVMRAREYADTWAPPKKESPSGKRRPITVAKSPHFTCEARIQYHREVVVPKRKMKEAAEERARRREQRLKEEEEEREIKEYRRTLVPKARLMPNFFGPVFQPDYTASQPATKGKEPRLSTASRFGPTRAPPGAPVFSIHSPMERPDPYLGSLQRQPPPSKGEFVDLESTPLKSMVDANDADSDCGMGESGRQALAALQQQLSNANSGGVHQASDSLGSLSGDDQENDVENDDVQAMVALRQQLSNAKMYMAPVVASAPKQPEENGGADSFGADDMQTSP